MTQLPQDADLAFDQGQVVGLLAGILPGVVLLVAITGLLTLLRRQLGAA